MLATASLLKVGRLAPRAAAFASSHVATGHEHKAADHKHGHGEAAHADHGHGHHGHMSNVERAMFSKTHMNFHPVPQGSWQEYHDKRNTRWNIQLAASIAFLIVTFVAMKQVGMFNFFGMPDYKKIKVDAYKSIDEQP